jgi:hypothetical protein
MVIVVSSSMGLVRAVEGAAASVKAASEEWMRLFDVGDAKAMGFNLVIE